jgi:hypothetical protein
MTEVENLSRPEAETLDSSASCSEPTKKDPSSSDLMAWLLAPPLIPGEDPANYFALCTRILTDAPPRDFIEQLLAMDIIKLTWEIFRLRRLKAGTLRISVRRGLVGALGNLDHDHSQAASQGRTELATGWVRGDPKARERVALKLQIAGLNMDDVMAQTLGENLDTFERVDRMLASAEARRNNALREIDRHRESFATAIRHIADLEDETS